MPAIIGSPAKYVQGKGELKRLYCYISQLASKGAYAVVDPFVYDHYKGTDLE